MRKLLSNEITTPLLLSVITVLFGLTTWFGYTFANHMLTMLAEHEQRIDQNETDIAVLKQVYIPCPGKETP